MTRFLSLIILCGARHLAEVFSDILILSAVRLYRRIRLSVSGKDDSL